MKILIIEDDRQTAATIREVLKDRYAVDVAYTGEDGAEQAQVNDYDLIILDLILPDMDGVAVCKEIREGEIKTPILILTGKLQTEDKVKALDSGADDYLTKPLSSDELLARVRALLRRDPAALTSDKLSAGGLTLDVAANTVKYKGKKIHLRRRCFQLLEYLMRNKGRVVTRSMILEHVWESSVDLLTNTIDVHINALRDEIDRPFGVSLIRTVHGLGYKIEGGDKE